MIQLCDKKDCTGCGLCSAVCGRRAIEMKSNKNGFYYPEIDETKCVSCGMCIKSCPQLSEASRNNIRRYYKAYSLENEIRKNATSGGVVTHIAKSIVDKHGTYYGVAKNETESGIIGYSFIKCTDDALAQKCQGSKYIQVYLEDIYDKIREDLSKGMRVLFVGTPCQVDAIKRYTGFNQNLFTIDFVCHGVASGKVFNMFLDYILQRQGKSITDVQKINFRDKSEGYDRGKFVVCFSDGSEYRDGSYTNPFGYGFASDLLSRDSCMRCKYASLERVGDLTVGDFTATLTPEEKEKGVSLCAVNSEKGLFLMNMAAKKIYMEQLEEKLVVENAYHLTKIPSRNSKRKCFQYDVASGKNFEYLVQKYLVPPKKKVSIRSTIRGFVKNLIENDKQ